MTEPARAVDLSEADRVLICSPDTRKLRSRVALFGASYRLQLPNLHAKVPSYVYAAALALADALDRWEGDERSCTPAR